MNPKQELSALEHLLDELLKGIQDILISGEILTDEFQLVLAKELEATVTRIDQLKSQLSVEALQPRPEPVLQQGMPSSNVGDFGYDDETGRLLVRFLGDYPDRNGPIYAYEGVPKVIFDLFQSGAVPARSDGENKWGKWWKGKVPSLGASMFTLIKSGNYPYQRLS